MTPKSMPAAACALALAAFCLAVPASDARADEDFVRSKDGKTFVTGTVIAHDEKTIVVRTRFGNMKLERAKANCFGTGCPPELAAAPADIRVSGSTLAREKVISR